jgi:hypothetical protein
MKQEVEMALQLLEKDIHEKQDSIIGLRKQLEDVKNINLQMYDKLEVTFYYTIFYVNSSNLELCNQIFVSLLLRGSVG